MMGRTGGESAARLRTRQPEPAEISVNDLTGGRTQKQFLAGTHRSRDPQETVDGVRPHFGELGITRVANVTGLDRIGIPVVMVVRPNSRSLSVSQGKGLTLAAARASGIMESLESHHAERADCPIWMDSYQRLNNEVRVADPA